MNNRNPQLQEQLTSGVCSSIAVGLTIFRVFVRRRRFWVDDKIKAWACISMLALVIQVAAVFTSVPDHANSRGIIRYYFMAAMFYAVIWSSRISILCSVIRIDIHPGRQKAMFYVAILYFSTFAILVGQLFWVCQPNPGNWKEEDPPQCKLSRQVVISQLISDIIADLILLLVPIHLFLLLRNRLLRYRLMVIFSTCIVTTVVSLVHASFILKAQGVKVVISALVEDSISLVVCNIPVVVASIVQLQDPLVTRTDEKIPSFLRTMNGLTRLEKMTESLTVDGQ